MKRILGLVLALAVVMAGTGCVAVSAKHNRFGNTREAVVVNDRVYVVNKVTGEVREVDLTNAKPFSTGDSSIYVEE